MLVHYHIVGLTVVQGYRTSLEQMFARNTCRQQHCARQLKRERVREADYPGVSHGSGCDRDREL